MIESIGREMIKYGVFALHLSAIMIAAYHIWKRKAPRFLKAHAIQISFALALSALIGSLFYSEYLGFVPCKLCWFQRIFIYPLVPIYLIAYFRNDNHVFRYTVPLALIGAAIAMYHYMTQIISNSQACALDAVSCSARYVFHFGYITIPLMAFTITAYIIYLAAIAKD